MINLYDWTEEHDAAIRQAQICARRNRKGLPVDRLGSEYEMRKACLGIDLLMWLVAAQSELIAAMAKVMHENQG